MASTHSTELRHLVEHEMATGNYRSEDEVLLEAVRLLAERNRLLQEIDAGTRQLERGEYTDYDVEALRARFDGLKVGGRFERK